MDFEAKETNHSPKKFPRIPNCTYENCGGVSFVLIRFAKTEDIYLLERTHLLKFWERMLIGGRKSIKKEEIQQLGHYISLGMSPRIVYIRVIDSLYNLK
ncbi:Holliday junction resolvase RecU [Bacillus kwashiorkori]|uniref:Holliday junction resolvase RecU n=1 Tax=Bacillus kwashiorkori TaxID=1522318 RepID=UPI00098194EB